MARRKKNETVVGGGGGGGTAAKPPPAATATSSSTAAAMPVRKSSRQIARKQSIDAIDGKKQNGDLLNKSSPAAPIINKESSKNTQKNSSQIIIANEGGKIPDNIDAPIVPRKRGRPRLSGNRNTNKINNTKNSNPPSVNNTSPSTEVEKDLEKIENNSKEILEAENTNVVTDIVVPTEEVIVDNCHEMTNEVDTTEEVIEETIVCEEMEVEIDGNTDEITINSNEYIVQDENVGNEQVIIMDESRFEDDNNVVLLIDDKNEAMITNSEEIVATNEYEIIEESLECLSVNNQQDDSVNTQNDIKTNSESCYESQQFISTYDDVEDQLPASMIENVQSRNNSTDNIVEESDLSMDCSSRDVFDEMKNSEETSNTSTTVNEQLSSQDNLNIEDNLPENTEMIVETIVEESSAVEISTNVSNEVDLTGTILSEKIYNIELDGDSHDITVETTISENIVEIETESIQEEESAKSNENSYNELSQNHEDCSRESVEIDVKNYSEDIKTYCNNSASENSNDTLVSNNTSSKTEDSSGLKVQNQIDGGSTDTTSSENGSNSSGIRRSSRIRSQGLMKQRSRGRGLVTKPIADITKAMQEREAITGQSKLGQFKKDSVVDNFNSSEIQGDTQSDKENTNKSVDLFDLNTATTTTTTMTSSSSLSVMTTTSATTTPLPPPPASSTVSPSTMSGSSVISCDSDTIKPVKVKSRWRRISELEMGSTTGSLSSTTPSLTSNSSFGNLTNDHNSAHGSFSSSIDNNDTISSSSCHDNSSSIKSTIDVNDRIIDDSVVEQEGGNDDNNKHEELNNHKLSTIGEKKIDNLSKNKLPAIREENYDRELAERLSQFERIKENLYLSQRYINKETKRMVCDCFLTDEDIERGELGCGEDCLNRLLMIECGSRCVVSNRCTNKRFQKCKYSGCEVFRTEKKGFGLRATSDILPGEFIMEYVGEVLNPKDFRRRAKEYSKDKNKHYYFMALKSDQIIDATVKGNISRFINHSCDPNSETQKWTVNGELRIGFFNRRFISAGEEITFDYHFQRYGKEAQRCYCESANCRGWIGDTPEEEKDKLRKKKDNKIDNDYFSSSASSVASSSSSSTMSSPSPSPSPSLSYPSPSPSPSPSVTSVSSITTAATTTTTKASTVASKSSSATTTRTRKKKEIKNPFMEDEDLEEEIEKLCAIGLKNRAHTLNLSRLMVRSRESEHRNRLLKVIQDGEPACRRLFLDYQGLRLIWSYMMDASNSEKKELQQFKLELLKTLNTLPIPNKTMLMDSKVYDVVQKWSNDSDDDTKLPSKNVDIVDNQQNEIKKDDEKTNCDTNEIINNDENYNNQNDNSCKINNDNDDDNKIKMIVELAKSILDKWSNLKEVFRIPKKERIEQMKEHEREADIGYNEVSEKEERRDSYERQRIDRYSGGRRDDLSMPSSTSSSSSSLLVLTSRDRRSINKGRDSPDLENLYRNKQDNNKRSDERSNLVSIPRLSKYERRQLFALQVAREEEEERLRKQQQNTWHEHESRCHALGLDPYTTPLNDSQTGYPIFFDQLHGQWQSYPPTSIQEQPPDMQIPHCNSMYMPINSQPIQQQQQQQQQPPPSMHSMIGPRVNSHQHHQPGMPIEALTSTMPTPSLSSIYDMNQQQTPYQTQYSNSNLITLHNSSSSNINCVTPKPVQSTQHMYMNPAPVEKPTTNLSNLTVIESVEKEEIEEETVPEILDLPPKWKSAKDARGRVYYYHVKERIPQWLPPPPTHIGLGTESSSSSESSEEESSSSEEDAEVENEPVDDFVMMPDDGSEECIKGIVRTDPRTACLAPEAKKRRNGLVQERIISPRREEDRVDRKKHKLLKEKLRRHKERGKHKNTKEHGEKLRKHRRSNKSKSHSKHTETKLQAIAQSNDLSAERKIKDMFRINMANVIVRFLNPHRQNDCKQGRITNTEDFKYLARKLTHFVLAKELKHCKSVDELQCNENVKHKAKDFVRKYMNKFGPVYQRSFDED